MSRIIIIAEAGVNHNGDIDLAKKLVDVAANAGADYVKFQTFKAEKLVSQSAAMAAYQKVNLKAEKNAGQFEMLKKLELTSEMHQVLMDHCAAKGIRFLSTGFDSESVRYLYALGMELFKIPSGEITNLPLLQQIGSYKKHVVLSTGMSTMEEVGNALDVLVSFGTPKENIILLHCTTEYPAPMNEVNLSAMKTMREAFGTPVGYSDHTMGIEIPIAAAALGAVLIEKHITLDKQMEGPDHKASLEPGELLAMVSAIRNIEKAIGDGKKIPSASEIKNIAAARKSIHSAREINKGEIIKAEDLRIIRPGTGISPMKMNELIGRKMKTKVPSETLLKWEDLE